MPIYELPALLMEVSKKRLNSLFEPTLLVMMVISRNTDFVWNQNPGKVETCE